MSDGKRKITSITELTGLEEDEIHLQEIFAFKQNGITKQKEVDGEYILYDDKLPSVYHKISSFGITEIDNMFHQKTE